MRNRSKAFYLAVGCLATILVLFLSTSARFRMKEAVHSGQTKVSAEPLQVVRFTIYDVGIYPRQARADAGLIALTIDDLSGGSGGLAIKQQSGQPFAQVRRADNSWRGRSEVKLSAGHYWVYDVSRPANGAELIVEP